MVFILIRDADQRPSVLQIVGILAAIATLIQLLVIAKRHQRDGEGSPKIQIRRRRPDSTVMRVKARNHFGLRGVDR